MRGDDGYEATAEGARLSGLVETTIPAGMIAKEVLTDQRGEPLCGYEDWLRELVNSSDAFMAKSAGAPFLKPESESHGECDAVADGYSLDFKLVLGWSAQRALRECSSELIAMDNGAVMSCASRASADIDAVRLHAALRGFDYAGLSALWRVGKKKSGLGLVERDVASFLKTLDFDKNLLLLYPVLLHVDDGRRIPRDRVSAAVYDDFESALQLRRGFHPGKDTFIAFFWDGELVVLESLNSGFRSFDSIPVSTSKTFMKVSARYSVLDYGRIALLRGSR